VTFILSCGLKSTWNRICD